MVFPNVFNRSLIKCENCKWPETQVLLPPVWSWLSNSRISKFYHSFYMVIISHSFKALLCLLLLSHPTISKFCRPFTMEIFWIGNPSSYILVFLEIGRNYISPVMSIIIIIVSIITLLVSQNIFVGFFIPMSHGVNKKTRPSAFPNLPLPYQVFTRIIYCLTKKYLINFLLLW